MDEFRYYVTVQNYKSDILYPILKDWLTYASGKLGMFSVISIFYFERSSVDDTSNAVVKLGTLFLLVSAGAPAAISMLASTASQAKHQGLSLQAV